MSNNAVKCSCTHENDACSWVMVATPHVPSIMFCNANCERYLYKSQVHPQVALRQHEALVTTLQRAGVRVLDVSDHIPLHELPLDAVGNLVFTRDPLLVTNKGAVLGRFRESVRRYETSLMENLLPVMGISLQGKVEGVESFIEGGDFIPAGDACFVAVGNRTNIAGVQEMMNKDLFGTATVVVVQYPPDNDMAAIHLDCYLGVVGRRIALIWQDAINRVTVDVYHRQASCGGYELAESGQLLSRYMEKNGWKVIPVPTYAQRKYGCNVLDLGNGRVLTQEEFVTNSLVCEGIEAIHVPFDEIHKMYGGIRCATQALLRVSQASDKN